LQFFLVEFNFDLRSINLAILNIFKNSVFKIFFHFIIKNIEYFHYQNFYKKNNKHFLIKIKNGIFGAIFEARKRI